MIIAIDFDGTCVTHEYPAIGKSIGAEPVLNELIDSGCQFILWTMRSKGTLQDAVQWFKDRRIPLLGVNENPGQSIWTSSPKVYAPLYIDDAGLGIPLVYGEHPRPYVDWIKVREWLVGMQLIYK